MDDIFQFLLASISITTNIIKKECNAHFSALPSCIYIYVSIYSAILTSPYLFHSKHIFSLSFGVFSFFRTYIIMKAKIKAESKGRMRNPSDWLTPLLPSTDSCERPCSKVCQCHLLATLKAT